MPAIATHLGLPPDTPLLDVISPHGDTRDRPSPLSELKMATGRLGSEPISYPAPRSPEWYQQQYLMPADHLTYGEGPGPGSRQRPMMTTRCLCNSSVLCCESILPAPSFFKIMLLIFGKLC